MDSYTVKIFELNRKTPTITFHAACAEWKIGPLAQTRAKEKSITKGIIEITGMKQPGITRLTIKQ